MQQIGAQRTHAKALNYIASVWPFDGIDDDEMMMVLNLNECDAV